PQAVDHDKVALAVPVEVGTLKFPNRPARTNKVGRSDARAVDRLLVDTRAQSIEKDVPPRARNVRDLDPGRPNQRRDELRHAKLAGIASVGDPYADRKTSR